MADMPWDTSSRRCLLERTATTKRTVTRQIKRFFCILNLNKVQEKAERISHPPTDQQTDMDELAGLRTLILTIGEGVHLSCIVCSFTRLCLYVRSLAD